MSDQEFNFSPFRVLLVEDNDFIRFTVRKHLTGLGLKEVLDAPNGFEGMKMLESQNPDIVVCDIRMEPVNGFDFLDHVRGKGSPYRKMPVIFLTSSSDPSDVKRAMDAGIDGYLLKPVDVEELKKKLTGLLKKIQK